MAKQLYAGPPLPSVVEMKAQFPKFRLDVPGFKGELDPHQHIAVGCAHVAKKFLNMDKVGLGKTIETLGLIAYQMSIGIKPRWIIAVEGAHFFQWSREIEKFLGIKAVRVRGSKAKRKKLYAQAYHSDEFILLITYGSVRVDLDYIRAIPDRKMAYDEASLLANDNLTHKHTRWLNKGCEYGILMSAEPVTRGDPNQLNMCFKALDAPLMDDEEFDTTFCVREEKKVWVKGRFGPFKRTISTVVGVKNADHLKKLLVNKSIRRGDSVLPSGSFTINRQIRSCVMTPYQRDIYRHIRKGVLKKLNSMSQVERLNTADYITQTLSSPWVNDDEAPKDSPKLDVVVNMLKHELPKEKVVLFCKHLRSCELASEVLAKHGIKSCVYTGKLNIKQRDELLHNEFINGDSRVLIMSGAGHRGIDGLQKVSCNLILLDVVFSPAFVIQLIGRLARRGQESRIINVYFTVCEDTVETLVMDKLHERQSVADRIYSEDKAELFKDEVIDLLMEMK